MNYKRILNLFLILVLCLSFITPLILPTPVLAAEEEEEDNFTTMPNYRWDNESTTDSLVSEQLIGDNYEVYNANNETSGTQKFEKSRQLNSRDFYFESRFGLDIGGNQTEYFQDIQGNKMDFEDSGDQGWAYGGGVSAAREYADGLLSLTPVGAGLGDTKLGSSDFVPSITPILMDNVRIRMKASTDTSFSIMFWESSWVSWLSGTVTNEWTIFEGSISEGSKTNVIYVNMNLRFTFVADSVIYIDFIEIFGDLDYATHVESEVEDTWDWEDSDEYWYDEKSNVSDFNDGTTEDWIAIDQATIDGVTNGWLNTTISVSSDWMRIGNINLSINASTYKYIAVELFIESGTIDYIVVTDNDTNTVFQDNTDISAGTTYLVAGELGLGHWTGTEVGIKIYAKFKTSADTHAINYNMTYLYDTELGELEGFERTAMEREHVNPEGYWVGYPQAGNIKRAIIYEPFDSNIDTDQFTYAKIRFKSYEPTQFLFAGYDTTFQYFGSWMDLEGNNSWIEFIYDLTESSSWKGTFKSFGIGIQEEGGVGTLDGDELVVIDYILLLGHWSEDDGFKFSLLNSDDEEGMSFQFTRNIDLSYNISIDMYDSVGVALDYEYSFDYNMDVDGWLRIRVDWHLDKRRTKILLEYDNGSDILRIRGITELYGGNLGLSRLLLLEDGFPSLCMNNSMYELARSYVIINYIDADWVIIEWREPVGVWVNPDTTTKTQDLDTDFTAVSPYGCTIFKKNVTDKSKWYRLAVDRFDGLNFEYKGLQENLDGGDYFYFVLGAYNVHINGTLEHLYTFKIEMNNIQTAYFVYEHNTLITNRFSTGETECEGSLSFYYGSNTKIVMQYKYEDSSMTKQGTLTSRPTGESFTKEMVFIIAYDTKTSGSTGNDDIVEFNIGGFELTRKDILGWIVGTILGPFFKLIGILFSPFIILFQILSLAIVKAFKDLLIGLEPLFDILGDIFGTVIGTLESAIGGFLETLEEGLVNAFEELWTILFGVADLLYNFIVEVVDLLFPVLSEMINAIIGFFAALLFFFWDALGLPDLLAILDFVITYFGGFLTNIGQIIADITTAIFFLGPLGLVLWWVWCVFLPVVANDPATAAGEIIDRFFKPIFPWDILGFRPYFPQGIFFTALTYFLIIAPAGGMYAIW